ncbi:GMC oxidoreductase [Catenovulum maritimum]|uniref:Glucose-methanol-choline oxidoreductase n=1 Tax=Catenovulum maritimum TaxID=1513271 RepID=A0A0J8GT22_9ALTE|nr:GMC family oxidoreductase [Catenovulum maritimum]KMT63853.1 glucose-methanol-choline oxidoreductase [Catenovulum maritimum]
MQNNPDVLIIGSGVAGAAIASKILGNNPQASVLMLEAGSKVKMRDFALHQEYLTTGNLPYKFCEDEPYPTKDSRGENQSIGSTLIPMNGSRLMIYGGSTVHWGGWSFRLKPEDFKLKSNAKNAVQTALKGDYDLLDWPISYDELEPYYSEAEKYIGVSGDSEDPTVPRSQGYPYPAFPYTLEDKPAIQALEKLNIPYSHMPIARHGINDSASVHAPCQTTGTCKYCPFGARYAAANYIDAMLEFENYPNFEVKTNVIVESLIMSSKNHVKGVRYIDKSISATESQTLEAKVVIVAAGAVESSKLLLRSQSDYWPQGVGNDHDLVGRNLITHPYIMFEAELAENPDGLMPEMDFPTLVSRYFDSEAEQALGKYIIVNPSSSIGTRLAKEMQQGHSVQVIKDMVTGKTNIQLHVLVEIFSQQNNRLLNSNRKNHFGLPETIIEFSQGPDFDERLQQIKQQMDKLFAAMNASESKIKTISWRADHAACTTRMSDTASTGVVDKNLKVFDVDNLYICSNASFSSLGAVNPTLTLSSLSLRLGEYLNKHILESLNSTNSEENAVETQGA